MSGKKTELIVEPTVRIFLPLLEETGTEVSVDQTENVIINGTVTQIRRGEYVDVKVPVFMQLKQRYPNL
ncbi:MAG: hypothetical protein PUE14_11130 [Clostridia bacterium]|nr:hypothetical protein [Clostridia bacterium]